MLQLDNLLTVLSMAQCLLSAPLVMAGIIINTGVAAVGLEGVVVGYISGYQHSTLYANKPVAWIDEIVAREDARKQGIGKKLMKNVLAKG
ncbi:MAG: GNAT family N-acetyltransferase [Chloroflexi bacterium]|nr:GNAT family N-acetyltransferase [Chloroflexota bacterium]